MFPQWEQEKVPFVVSDWFNYLTPALSGHNSESLNKAFWLLTSKESEGRCGFPFQFLTLVTLKFVTFSVLALVERSCQNI